MFDSVLRRGTILGMALTVIGLFATATPALASERPIDISGYKVADIPVADSNCRNPTVTASIRVKPDFVDSFASIDITCNGGLVPTPGFEGRRFSGRSLICPSLDALGTYKMGAADIIAECGYYDSYFGDYLSDYSSYTDNTSKKFHVRGKAKSTLNAKRLGSTLLLTAKAEAHPRTGTARRNTTPRAQSSRCNPARAGRPSRQ